MTVNNEINSQEIELVQGWSIFSTYIQPNDPDIISVFNPIAENVIIIKDNLGSVIFQIGILMELEILQMDKATK